MKAAVSFLFVFLFSATAFVSADMISANCDAWDKYKKHCDCPPGWESVAGGFCKDPEAIRLRQQASIDRTIRNSQEFLERLDREDRAAEAMKKFTEALSAAVAAAKLNESQSEGRDSSGQCWLRDQDLSLIHI